MTRLLVIGSSHVGAYKNASADFAARFGGVQATFFGVRGPLFLTGKMDAHQRFVPPARSDKDIAFVTATNGTLEAETKGYDHLLIVGHRFAFNMIATLLENHDILEGIRTGRPRVLGETMLRETIDVVTRAAVDDAVAAFTPCEAALTFAMAPYPAQSILERGDGYALARTLRLFWDRPDAAWVFEMWQQAAEAALAAHGHRILHQPEMLNAGAYATKSEFAARAQGLDGDKTGKTDHRHMNADYGLAMLSAFAQTRLGLTPDTAPPPKERIA